MSVEACLWLNYVLNEFKSCTKVSGIMSFKNLFGYFLKGGVLYKKLG